MSKGTREFLIFMVWMLPMAIAVGFACNLPPEYQWTKHLCCGLTGVLFGLTYFRRPK